MAQVREKIVIDASGQPGASGFQYYGERDGVAPAGCPGANGRSSCTATQGEAAKDIHVTLEPGSQPGVVNVRGRKGQEQGRWEVTNDQILLLNVKGGDGGDGGRGEDGQQGGAGRRGRNATKYRDAEHGGMGARGGDGGYGTNGAEGGKAGNVFVEVKEDDMDLLLPLFWDIRGGKGGASGTHGEPGDGGVGGDGGDGIVWTERQGDRTYTRSRPHGAPGPQGPPGNRPATYLSGGIAGTNGSSQVTVLRNDGTQATYPSAYCLKVVSFDIIDENEDGVNEPGEHLRVRNIKVENTGGMPSPKTQRIKVLIHGTHWLDPVTSEPVFLPTDIKPGETVTVPGTLRAFITQERTARNPGQLLHAQDEVQLIATAERLGRTLTDFSGATKISIRYPVELDAPKYLDCVERGDTVTFSWVLRNISTKPYGVDLSGTRKAATALNDPGGVFDFADATSPGRTKVFDFVEELEPGFEVTISQTFTVSSRALPYSEGFLDLQLLLSEPSQQPEHHSDLKRDHDEHPLLRTVVRHRIRMQIADTYAFNPDSTFLLVVNAYTMNPVIHQVINFIQHYLKLEYDIFNVSIAGNLLSPSTGRPVLADYLGKSIILFTNSFPFFNTGTRKLFDLLDPYLVGSLARANTSFLMVGPNESQEAAVQWSKMLDFLDYNPTLDAGNVCSVREATSKALHVRLCEEGAPTPNPQLPCHSYPSQKALFSSPAASLAKNAQSSAAQMKRALPLRRFTVQGQAEQGSAEAIGRVNIYEGLPLSAKIRYSLQDFDIKNSEIPDFNKFAIVSSLPFAARTQMMWNVLRSGGEASQLVADKLYAFRHVHSKQDIVITVKEDRKKLPVDEQICQAIMLSIEHDLLLELSTFLSKTPWPDPIPAHASLAHLPYVSTFLSMSEKCASDPAISSTEGSAAFTRILGSVLAAVAPMTIWGSIYRTMFFGWRSRKAGLVPHVSSSTSTIISAGFAPGTAPQIEESVNAQRKVAVDRLRKAGSARKGMQDLAGQRLKDFVRDGSGQAYFDLPVVTGAIVILDGQDRALREAYDRFMQKVAADSEAAAQSRREMVS